MCPRMMWCYMYVAFLVVLTAATGEAATGPPDLKAEATRLDVMEEERAILVCTVTPAENSGSITWNKDGKKIKRENYYFIHNRVVAGVRKYQLWIRQTRKGMNHYGEYQCVAVNNEGSAVQTINLYEAKAAKIRPQPPATYDVELLNNATFSCQFAEPRSVDPRNMTWETKDRLDRFVEVEEDARHIITRSGSTTTLTIKSVTPKDKANYGCAVNYHGTIYRQKSPTKLSVIVPKFGFSVDTPDRVDVYVGEDAVIPCITENVDLSYSRVSWWSRDNLYALEGFAYARHSVEYDAAANKWSLKIKQTRLSDEGKYECEITNIYGVKKKTNIVTLNVKARPDKTNPVHVTAGYGQSVTLYCKNKPKSVLQEMWTDGKWKLLTHGTSSLVDSRLEPSEGKLVIKYVKEADEKGYTCLMNGDGKMYYTKYFLNVHTDLIQADPLVVEVATGEDAVLPCLTFNLHKYVTWIDENDKILAVGDEPIKNKYALTDREGSRDLTITYLQISDAGLYRCVLNHEGRFLTQRFQLIVNN